MRNLWLLSGLSSGLAVISLIVAVMALTGALGGAPRSNLPDKSNPTDYTVALVRDAVRYYQENGRDATIAYYNSPASVDGSWYVFIYDENNIRIAHPTRPDLRGLPVNGPTGVDIAGYAYGQQMAETTAAGQWVDYVFLNPDTGFQQRKHSWLVKHDGLIFGSGWYQGSPVQAANKSNPTDYAVSLVNAALRRYQIEGRDATIAYYNSPENIDGEWYVFIIDANGKVAANADQSLLGQDLTGPLGVDITGYRFGAVMAATDESGQWVDYVFNNPDTGWQQRKHSWLVKRDGLIFGSGWYQGSAVRVADKSNPIDYTVSLVDAALRRYRAEGRDATIAYYNSPESVDGEWYVFILAQDGRIVAHYDQGRLGEDLKGPAGVDIAQYRYGDVLLAAPEEGRWVDYMHRNPASGNYEFKQSWAVRHEGLIFGAGWYQAVPPLGITKADPRAYAVAQVEQATELYQSRGRQGAVDYYNSPASVDGEWYVFILDENDRLIAHPNQALLGQDIKGDLGVDAAGYRFGAAIAAAPAEGRWVDYVYLNPASGNQEYKHTWVVRQDGLIFGAGWYQVLPNLGN